MSAFVILCLVLVFFTTVALVSLFASAGNEAASEAGLGLKTTEVWYVPLLTVFNIGFFGDFEMGVFDTIADPWLGKVVWLIFMVAVNVVALNALIAILGDSAERVQESTEAIRNRQLANLIVEYLDVATNRTVRQVCLADSCPFNQLLVSMIASPECVLQIEDRTVWFHVLVPL